MKKFSSGDVTWYSNKGKKLCSSTVATSDTIVVLLEEAVKNGLPNTPNGLIYYIDNFGEYCLSDDERGVLQCYIDAGEGDEEHNWR